MYGLGRGAGLGEIRKTESHVYNYTEYRIFPEKVTIQLQSLQLSGTHRRTLCFVYLD